MYNTLVHKLQIPLARTERPYYQSVKLRNVLCSKQDGTCTNNDYAFKQVVTSIIWADSRNVGFVPLQIYTFVSHELSIPVTFLRNGYIEHWSAKLNLYKK